MSSAPVQRRSYYRIVYSEKNCPTLLFSGARFPVLDLSEEGFRIEASKSAGIKVGENVIGTITFHDNETFIVKGEVVRIEGKEISVKLTKHLIPWRKIMEEQRRFIQKFEKYE